MAALEAQEEIHKALDLSNLLGQAVDLAHDKIVKVLRVRSEQSTHLDLNRFLRYFTLNLHFANECEAISGRQGITLKNVVNGHIKDFVQRHGDAEKQKLAQGMESDQWSTPDFGVKETELLNQILEASTRDSATWAEGTKIWLLHPDDDDETPIQEPTEPAQTNGTSKPKARAAVIESETFLLPHSAVLCMKGIVQFLHLTAGIPSMTTDIAASLVAYLQLFNSRCTQLILGAGATRSAGLKNITTKHLAVASQALAFIAALIPHVREFIRRHCGSGPSVSALMAEFDKVRRLYQEHQNSIYDKLVEIMTGRAVAASKKMRALDWEAPLPSGALAHEYMETLAKETATLHRNLTRQLPEGTVRVIMVPVFKNYKDTFGSTFRALEPATEAGRQSMLGDVEYFESRLSRIDGFEDAAEYLSNIIKSKEIAAPPPPPSAPSTTTSPPPDEKEDAASPPPVPAKDDVVSEKKPAEESVHLQAQAAK